MLWSETQSQIYFVAARMFWQARFARIIVSHQSFCDPRTENMLLLIMETFSRRNWKQEIFIFLHTTKH